MIRNRLFCLEREQEDILFSSHTKVDVAKIKRAFSLGKTCKNLKSRVFKASFFRYLLSKLNEQVVKEQRLDFFFKIGILSVCVFLLCENVANSFHKKSTGRIRETSRQLFVLKRQKKTQFGIFKTVGSFYRVFLQKKVKNGNVVSCCVPHGFGESKCAVVLSKHRRFFPDQGGWSKNNHWRVKRSFSL